MRRALPCLLLLLAGCATPERCARRYPPTVQEVQVHDTLRLAGRERVDTLLNLLHTRDTSYLTSERVEVRWQRVADTLWRLRVQCPPDTLRSRSRTVQRVQTVAAPGAKGVGTGLLILYVCAALVAGLFVGKKLL